MKSGQPVKNVKTGPSLRFLLKWKTMWTALCALSFPLATSPFSFFALPFPLFSHPNLQEPQNHQQPSWSRNQTEKWEIGFTLQSPLSTHQQRLWFYTFRLSTHQNILGEKKVRIYKDVVVAWELFPYCSVFCVLFMFCVLFNGGSFCHVLYSCMRKKLVTEPRRVPIKILGICFTFWPVPKNYQKKIKIINYISFKKITKSKSVESLSILWWLWIYYW